MLHHDRVYMLAADHRWQWEEWCDARGIPRARISEAKELARRGFVLARERSPAAREYGSLLLDEQYASPSIARALADGIEVGTPAERAGAFPLAWASDPFSRALTGQFVKVLVRHRDDHPAAVREEQLVKLLALQHWCRNAGKPLVIEVLVPRGDEPEDAFDASDRPATLASFIGECYGRGLTPEFWKIEGTPGQDGARLVDAAIRERPACRQIILGKAADLATIAQWFVVARQGATASGFAIGRSVFWSPSTDFLTGTLAESDAIERICGNYLDLIATWER
jgi:5-dehydro-2-deoxygluconokinase